MEKTNTFYTTPSFVIGILLLNLRPIIDKLFVTRYFSSADIVLIGTVNLITFIPECIVLSSSYAIQSLTSSNTDQRSTFHYLIVGFIITLSTLLPTLGLLMFFPEFFLKLVSQSAPTDATAVSFFRIRLIGCFFQCLIFCMRGFYAAHRNNRIFFSVIALTLTMHTLLTRMLLSNSIWMPNLGILAMSISYSVSMLFGFSIYAEQLLRDARQILPTIPRLQAYRKLLKVSVPLTIHGIVDHIGTTLIFTTTSHFFGLMPLASLHLVSSVQGISPGAGFGLTALTEVSKLREKNPRAANRMGWRILTIGSLALGGIGLLMCIYSDQILLIAAPNNSPLRASTLLPLQLMLMTLFLHVGCQIILKILQAMDHTIASVSINLGFIYGFRVPLLFMMGAMDNASVVTVSLIIATEKLLKLSAMCLYWQLIAQPSRLANSALAHQST